jgi:sirohydrochlorin ferrochelatase
MRPALNMTTLLVAAHGSRDPRSAANTRAVAQQVRRARPGLDVQVAFLDRSTPNLRDVLAALSHPVVVAPLLLADAYHARVDIPAVIANSGAQQAVQASVLGEDSRLVQVAHKRLAEVGASHLDVELGVLVVAVGSSRGITNKRTATVAPALATGTRWAGAITAFATGPSPPLPEAARRLYRRGAKRLVIVPWFLAHGFLTDRVVRYARQHGIPVAEPLGAHPLVAETLLDRFDEAQPARFAA